MSIKLRRYEECEQIRTATEKMEHCLTYSREIFYVIVVLCSMFYVKVITSEECVPKHKLLVMDMRFKATKRRRRKFEPRVRVWKLKEEKTCEEFRCMVGDKVEEAK